MGRVYQLKESRFWWIKYIGLDRKPHYESSKSTRKGDAIDLLKRREGDLAHGIPVTAKISRLTFDEAAADLVTEYETNGRKSLDELKRRITKHLTPFFGGRRMTMITTTDVRAYVKHRQAQPIVVRKAHKKKLADGSKRDVPEQTKTVSNAEINVSSIT